MSWLVLGEVIRDHFVFKHKRCEIFLSYFMYTFKRHLIKLESCKHKIIMPSDFYSVLYIVRELCCIRKIYYIFNAWILSTNVST